MFDKPKTIIAAPKKPSAKAKAEVTITGIEHLAMIDALQKTLETLRGTIEAEVKTTAAQRFADHIQATGTKPENFTATEGGATASIQFRRKASNIALGEEAVALLREHGIEPEKQIVTPQLFAINPAYASDKALLGKVEKALAKIVPDDFIVMQEETAKLVCTEDTLGAAIAKKAPGPVIATLTTISCAPKLKETNLSAILEFVAEQIDAPIFGSAADEARSKKLRVVK